MEKNDRMACAIKHAHTQTDTHKHTLGAIQCWSVGYEGSVGEAYMKE